MSLVSVIIASYNKERFIEQTINSVLNQSIQNWELLIIDDCSTDKTVEKIQVFQSDNRILLFRNNENRGANYCRNLGINNAKGEFVIFLDADDLLEANCLEYRVKKISESDADFCVFSMGTFYNEIGDSKSQWKPESKHPLKDFFSHRLPWSVLQPIWKKSFLNQIGGFDENIPRLQDVELNTRALLHPGVKYFVFPDRLDCYYRIDEARKNFSSVEFLRRWITSAVYYFKKFEDIAKQKVLLESLKGTIYQTYLQLLYHLKLNNINKEEFKSLKDLLFDSSIEKRFDRWQHIGLKITERYNLLPFRIPGINKCIRILFQL